MSRGGALATLLAGALLLPSCHRLFHHPHDATPPDVRSAYDEADTSRVYEECGPKVPPNAKCGSVIQEVRRERPGVIREVCHETPGKPLSAECRERLNAMGSARLAERYSLADPAKVEQTCTGHPLECADPESYERVWLSIHNATVDAIRDQKIKKAVAEDDARKAREAAERKKQMAEAWDRAWASRPLHCTQTVVGSSESMTCE